MGLSVCLGIRKVTSTDKGMRDEKVLRFYAAAKEKGPRQME